MPCEVCRLVGQDCLRQSSLTVTRKSPRYALHLDDSGSLGVLSTPIKTRWKGLLARRKLYICRRLRMCRQYQPVAPYKIKFDQLEHDSLERVGPGRRAKLFVHSCKLARSVIHRFWMQRHVRPGRPQTSSMDSRALGRAEVAVAITDSELLDQVLSLTAVVGVEPLLLSDASLLRPHWSSAAMVLLGVEQADRVAAMAMPRRAEVYLVAEDSAAPQAQPWSMRLGAAVAPLPSSASWLSDALADVMGTNRRNGRVICVVGGSGGVGASTLAAGLAFVTARTKRTLLIDADPRSGGLDLLMGAERIPGWRWPRLATARGHLGNLTGQLPSLENVDLLSTARDESPPGWELGAEQVKAVLSSAMRSHEMTVVDVSRAFGSAGREALRRAELTVLVVRDDVRGVAAGCEVARQLAGECARPGLVVRQGRSRHLEPRLVASGVGWPLLGSFADDSGLLLAAERGDPPARSARSSLARLCLKLLSDLSEPTLVQHKARGEA
jgi:secretion/DNA translocation related CpaE-like protein